MPCQKINQFGMKFQRNIRKYSFRIRLHQFITYQKDKKPELLGNDVTL